MIYLWSCADSVCPSACTGKLGNARCVKIHGEYHCQTSQPSLLVLCLTIASSCLVAGLTLVEVFAIAFEGSVHAEYKARRLIGFCLCNGLYVVGLFLATILPITAFSSRPGSAGVFAVPLVPLSLLINESKWIVHAWSKKTSDVPIIRRNGGLSVIAPTFMLSALVAAAIICLQTGNEMKQPYYTLPFEGQYLYLNYCAASYLLFGALASMLVI